MSSIQAKSKRTTSIEKYYAELILCISKAGEDDEDKSGTTTFL
jgi:hypothetical protein